MASGWLGPWVCGDADIRGGNLGQEAVHGWGEMTGRKNCDVVASSHPSRVVLGGRRPSPCQGGRRRTRRIRIRTWPRTVGAGDRGRRRHDWVNSPLGGGAAPGLARGGARGRVITQKPSRCLQTCACSSVARSSSARRARTAARSTSKGSGRRRAQKAAQAARAASSPNLKPARLGRQVAAPIGAMNGGGRTRHASSFRLVETAHVRPSCDAGYRVSTV